MFIIVPFIVFTIMVAIGQFKGCEMFLIYSLIPMILMFMGIICQMDIVQRKEEVRWIFNK